MLARASFTINLWDHELTSDFVQSVWIWTPLLSGKNAGRRKIFCPIGPVIGWVETSELPITNVNGFCNKAKADLWLIFDFSTARCERRCEPWPPLAFSEALLLSSMMMKHCQRHYGPRWGLLVRLVMHLFWGENYKNLWFHIFFIFSTLICTPCDENSQGQPYKIIKHFFGASLVILVSHHNAGFFTVFSS